MEDMIRYKKGAENYMIVTRNGNMIAQIMEGGMFGDGNMVVIDNFGHTVNAIDEAAAIAAVEKIIMTGKLSDF